MVVSVRANFTNIYLWGMRDRSMRSRTNLAQEIQLPDWSTGGNLSNRFSGVQIPRDICTRFGRYLYSTKGSWIIKMKTRQFTFAQILAALTTGNLASALGATVILSPGNIF